MFGYLGGVATVVVVAWLALVGSSFTFTSRIRQSAILN